MCLDRSGTTLKESEKNASCLKRHKLPLLIKSVIKSVTDEFGNRN